MANISKQHISENQEKIQKLFEKFVLLNKKMIDHKFDPAELEKLSFVSKRSVNSDKNAILSSSVYLLSMIVIMVLTVFFSFLVKFPILDVLVDSTLGIRCVIPNNYFIWEATRPVTDCSMCENVTEVLNLQNVSREDFARFAYTSRPLVIRKAAAHWPAMKVFNFQFFKQLFETVEGSYESVEEECQFLTFKTEFLTLKDVFNMSQKRLGNAEGEKPWYVGWSICHPEMLSRMREYYPRPHFLPDEAEHSHLDYVFMGYQQGAVMHEALRYSLPERFFILESITMQTAVRGQRMCQKFQAMLVAVQIPCGVSVELDYISRLMWQAQIVGRKTWKLVPPPECDHVCNKMSVTVEPGDIVLLDTRQWYHDTTIEDGLFSLTVSSEYG